MQAHDDVKVFVRLTDPRWLPTSGERFYQELRSFLINPFRFVNILPTLVGCFPYKVQVASHSQLSHSSRNVNKKT